MVNVHFQHGMALRGMNRHEDAIKEFELARLEFPEDAETVIMLAWCHYSLAKYQPALKIAQSAAALDPNNEGAYTAMGACEIALDHYHVAQKYLRNAVELDPENAYAHYLLAYASAKNRKWREAMTEIDRSIELSPENADYLSYKSHILLMLNRKAEAKDASLAALRLTPEDSRTHSQHGQILLAEGRIEEAIQHYREAVRNDPRDLWLRQEYVEAARGRMWLFRRFLAGRLWLERQSPWLRAFTILAPFLVLPIGIMCYNHLLINDRAMEVIVTIFLSYIGLLMFVPVIMDGLTSLDKELKFVFPPDKRRKSIAVLIIFVFTVICVLLGWLIHVPFLLGVSILGLVSLVFLCVDEKGFSKN